MSEVIPNKAKLVYSYRPLHLIRPLPGNAKRHDLEDIKASIRKFGFVDPIGVNPATMHDLDGNGRLQALKMMFAAGEEPPEKIIFDEDGWGEPCWLAPTVDIDCGEEDEQIVAVRLNRSHDKGGYDKEALLAVLEMAAGQDRLEDTGYDALAMALVKSSVDHQTSADLDDLFLPKDEDDEKDKKEKIVLEFAPAEAARIKEGLLEHGKTYEAAVRSLLGL